MALIRCDFFSEVLGVQTSMTVVLPVTVPAEGFPTLYLLHGLSDDHSMWQRRTHIERYAALAGVAVVMPDVNRSFYSDEKYGLRYWTFLSEELPSVAESMFRLSDRREDTFVAGLSMGGYGAIKWALRCPERFGAAAALSGALDIVRIQPSRRDPVDQLQMVRIFGDVPTAGTPDDLFELAASVVDPPKLYLTCGTEDFLIDDNRRFAAAATAAGLDVTLDIGPGNHDWAYWDRTIQDVLAWLPLKPVDSPDD